MKCPCEDCITKSICRNKYTRLICGEPHLVLSLVQRCPLVCEYFGILSNRYEKIYKICKVFNVNDHNFLLSWSSRWGVDLKFNKRECFKIKKKMKE